MEGTEAQPPSPTVDSSETAGEQAESSWAYSLMSQEEFEGLKEKPLELLRAVELKLQVERSSASSALRTHSPLPWMP